MSEERANTDDNVKDSGKRSEERRSWVPNRQERRVKSKKAFDRQKMNHLVNDEKPTYKGELDPRKKDPDKKPRSISRSEEKLMQKAEKLAAAEGNDRERYRVVITDFRDQYEKCQASPGRLGALYATQQVRRRKAFAQEVIESTIDRSKLSAQDRAFATLLTLGVVSTQGSLDDVINRALASPRDIKPDVRDALRISTYEVIYLRKAPHAAVDQGVELVRAVAPSASGLANAVLHRILNMADVFPFGDPTKDLEALALNYAFPTWLAKQLIEDLGPQAAVELMRASNDPAPLFVCVNAIKATDEEVVSLFEEVGADMSPAGAGGIEPAGCYRVSNSRVLADGRIRRMFQQGKILVSDAAAQSVAAAVLEDGDPGPLLEVGAGRGTKTIMLQSGCQRKFGHQMELTSMDSHSFKSDLLKERADEYGVKIDDSGSFADYDVIGLCVAVNDALFQRVREHLSQLVAETVQFPHYFGLCAAQCGKLREVPAEIVKACNCRRFIQLSSVHDTNESSEMPSRCRGISRGVCGHRDVAVDTP